MFVKICGLRTRGDVAACAGAGADAVGFVLTQSPRQVDPLTVRRLVAELPPEVLSVAVFVGESAEVITRIAAVSGVAAVQVHGDRGLDDYRRLAESGRRIIRAVPAGPGLRSGARGEDMLVVDSHAPGSGESWDWRGLPDRPTGRWLLAGGLRPDNVADAIHCLEPWGVDVSSGVESKRGVKDPGRIAEFVSAARVVSANR